jgi:hypothetical protein
MRNVFLLYMPPGNLEAMTHYRDTIQLKVSFDQIGRFVSSDVAARIRHVFGNRPIAVWGSKDVAANRSKFERMEEGDDILIVEGDTIRFMGKVALKTINADLSRALWHNINTDETSGWDLIYFIANPVEIDVPFAAFCRLFSYAENYQLRGFATVANDRLEAFYQRYDDLYAILMRVKSGQQVIEKPAIAAAPTQDAHIVAPTADQVDQDLPEQVISDHVRMQWKIANLGLKAGEKIWVPTADQGRLRSTYNFSEFESAFSTGIDLQKRYYENIDVVWKEEYRIGAAFEVENSTSIYSGLLRFADLNVVAPNTLYPMFIVAPVERRNRVRDQVLRPAFKRLALPGKVRFLPYETIDDIERFFGNVAGGVSVELMQSKAEAIE